MANDNSAENHETTEIPIAMLESGMSTAFREVIFTINHHT